MSLPTVGTVVAGRYRLDSPIGSGANASVFRAYDTTLARNVAIKFLYLRDERRREWFVDHFLREARIAASIEHPNVVGTFDFGSHEGRPYMVMELLEGLTLRDRLESQRAPSLVEAADIGIGILSGLDAVHRAGIVHRDMKPDNVFLVPREQGGLKPMLVDFGVSRAVKPKGEVRSALTSREGMIVGTPEYMSPEQARGLSDVDSRCDLYGVGVILYEMLTGQLPYEGETMADLIVKIVAGGAPSAREIRPDLPQALSAVVSQAMAHEPEHRFSDARAMANAVRHAARMGNAAPAKGAASDPVPAAASAPAAPAPAPSAARPPAPPPPGVGAPDTAATYAAQAMGGAGPALAEAATVSLAAEDLELQPPALEAVTTLAEAELEQPHAGAVPAGPGVSGAVQGMQSQLASIQMKQAGPLELDTAAVAVARRVAPDPVSGDGRLSIGLSVPGEVRRGGGRSRFWIAAFLLLGAAAYGLTSTDQGRDLAKRARRVAHEEAPGLTDALPLPRGDVTVRLQGLSPRMTVVLDGQEVHADSFELARDGVTHVVQVHERGMESWQATFVADSDQVFTVWLAESR